MFTYLEFNLISSLVFSIKSFAIFAMGFTIFGSYFLFVQHIPENLIDQVFTAVSLPKIKNTKFLLKVPGIFKAITKEVTVTSAMKRSDVTLRDTITCSIKLPRLIKDALSGLR